MNEQIKARWVAALLSGKYKQGRGMLHDFQDNFCCLGVLCDLYSKEREINWSPSGIGYFMHDKFDILPTVVAEWAGIDGQSPAVQAEWYDKQGRLKTEKQTLGHINDSGVPFRKIAQYIREQL